MINEVEIWRIVENCGGVKRWWCEKKIHNIYFDAYNRCLRVEFHKKRDKGYAPLTLLKIKID